MAKIIPIDSIKKRKESPLTPLMIETLTLAFKKQHRNETIGQVELNGSFTVLVKRGMIDCKQFVLAGKHEVLWYVTKRGIQALREIDINLAC